MVVWLFFKPPPKRVPSKKACPYCVYPKKQNNLGVNRNDYLFFSRKPNPHAHDPVKRCGRLPDLQRKETISWFKKVETHLFPAILSSTVPRSPHPPGKVPICAREPSAICQLNLLLHSVFKTQMRTSQAIWVKYWRPPHHFDATPL